MSQPDEYDRYREDIVGRANVADTENLVNYYRSLERVKAGALWTVANKIEPWEPTSSSVPVLWRYAEMRDYVLQSLSLVTPESAGRRVVYLENPGRRDVAGVVGTLYSGLQAMSPGEAAFAHAHAASALRFIIEGQGAYTIVNGCKLTLGANDFVITPGGTWHEHGVDPSGTTCIWQDGLDVPLVNALETNYYAVHPALNQTTHVPLNASTGIWAAPGLRPQHQHWTESHSPLFKYEWQPTYEALIKFSQASKTDPFDCFLMHYRNPVTGGHVMPTMGASMQLLTAGFVGKKHRHTGSFVYHVAKGRGYSIISGQRFDWAEHDIFCVPPWAWHEHVNLSETDDACLFAFNDLPVMQALNLYREEAFSEAEETPSTN